MSCCYFLSFMANRGTNPLPVVWVCCQPRYSLLFHYNLSLVERQTILVFCISTSEGWNQFFYFDVHKKRNRSLVNRAFGVCWWVGVFFFFFMKKGRVLLTFIMFIIFKFIMLYTENTWTYRLATLPSRTLFLNGSWNPGLGWG